MSFFFLTMMRESSREKLRTKNPKKENEIGTLISALVRIDKQQ